MIKAWTRKGVFRMTSMNHRAASLDAACLESLNRATTIAKTNPHRIEMEQKITVFASPLSRMGIPKEKTERSKVIPTSAQPVNESGALDPSGERPKREADDEIKDTDCQPDLDRFECGGDDLLGSAREFHNPDDR